MDGWAIFRPRTDARLDLLCMFDRLLIFAKVLRQAVGSGDFIKHLMSLHGGSKLVKKFQHDDA